MRVPGTIANETLAYFIARVYQFLLRAGCKAEHVSCRQHLGAYPMAMGPVALHPMGPVVHMRWMLPRTSGWWHAP